VLPLASFFEIMLELTSDTFMPNQVSPDGVPRECQEIAAKSVYIAPRNVQVTNNTSLANGTFDLSDDDPGCSPTCGAATSSSRLTKVAFIEEAG
jgi:hypothetical protein